MFIEIETLEGEKAHFDLADVGNVYPSDDVIYFNGVLGQIPCRLSSARPALFTGRTFLPSRRIAIAKAAEKYCNDKNIPINPFNIVTALASMGVFDPKAGVPERDVIYDARQDSEDVTVLKQISQRRDGRKTYIAINLRDQE